MKKLFLLLILFAGIYTQSIAGYINGGQMDYKHLGNQKYEVTITIYRDCNGSSISNSPLSAKCGSSSGSASFTLTLVSVTDITVTPPGCSTKSRCAGTYTYGLEEHIFRGTVDLSSLNCCEVVLSWAECCRISSISTGARSTSFYLESMVNKCYSSSLKWADIDPPYLLPVGQDQLFSFAASDTFDFDSVSYKLVNPQSAAGTNVSYSGFFSAQKPISFLGFPNAGLNSPAGIQFDNLRANMTFRPTKQGEVTTWAIEASEWRKIGGTPTIIGKIRRENAVVVISSPNNRVPFQNSPNEFLACADTSIAIIDINDADTLQNLEVNLVHNLKWATATLTGSPSSRKVKVLFIADSIPPTGLNNAFTLEVLDNYCTPRARSTKTYSLRASQGNFTDTSYITHSISCSGVKFKAQNRLPAGPYSYMWTLKQKSSNYSKTADSIEVALYDTGWVKAELLVTSDLHCNYFTYYDSVYITPADAIAIAADPTKSVCNSDTLTLHSTPVFGTAPFKYVWQYTGDSVQNNLITPQKGINDYAVTLIDARGCKASTSVRVYNYHPTLSVYGDSLVCRNATAYISATFSGSIAPQYGWDGFAPGITGVSEPLAAPKLYTFRLVDGGCTFTKNKQVNLSEPIINYTNDTVFCVGDTMVLEAQPTNGTPPYTVYWNLYALTGQKVKITTTNASPGKTYFYATVTDAIGCKHVDYSSVTLNALPVLSTTTIVPVCSDAPIIDLSAKATPAGGLWYGAGINSSGGLDFTPANAGIGLHALKYNYTDPITNCSNAATVYQRVVQKPILTFLTDSTKVIKGTKLTFTNNTVADTSFTSSWVFTGPQAQTALYFSKNAEHTFNDTGRYTVKLVVNNGTCPADSLIKTDYINVYSPANTNGLTNFDWSNAAKVYPNPAGELMQVEARFGIEKIEITDVLGKSYTITPLISDNKTTLNTSQLKDGAYFITIYGRQGEKTSVPVIITH